MDRPIIYTQEIARGYDNSKGWQDALKATGQEAQDLLGKTITVAAGLVASATAPASLSINIGTGSLYQQTVLDANPAGDLPADGGTYFLQGVSWSTQTIALSTAALAVGQSQWALIEATFSFLDIIRSSDPDGGVLPFYNSANPQVPLQGQGGSDTALNTERAATVAFKVVYGTPATTGSEAPPSIDPTYIGLYLIDLSYGQTTITTPQILIAGPSVGTGVPSNYPYAPFLAGLLSSHHNGNPGQAPKINLATEVQGILPAANSQTTGSFTGTFSGPYASPITGTVNYVLNGNIATIYTKANITGTATAANTLSMSGLPANLTPTSSGIAVNCNALSNSSVGAGAFAGTVTVQNSGHLVINPLAVVGSNIQSSTFGATGTVGLFIGFSISYPLA